MNEEDPQPLSYAARPERPKNSRLLGLLLATAIAGLVVFIILPSLPHSHHSTCEGNLGRIGRECLIYAESHGGNLPPNLNVLVATGASYGLAPTQLNCLKTGLPFVYIAGQTIDDDPDRNIVAYEPVGSHPGSGGANVLHLDGSPQWLQAPSFAQELAATRARLATTRPAESRPAAG